MDIADRIRERLKEIVMDKLSMMKIMVALDEANVMKMGRITKIRRRIRRNAKGRIIVQKNKKRSGLKGYRLHGSTVKRIPAYTRIHKARMLKRSWKTKRRAKMRRTLFKRKMSMRRRKSMGLK